LISAALLVLDFSQTGIFADFSLFIISPGDKYICIESENINAKNLMGIKWTNKKLIYTFSKNFENVQLHLAHLFDKNSLIVLINKIN
jgi:hypothetical protein